jgi:hypothetical protein
VELTSSQQLSSVSSLQQPQLSSVSSLQIAPDSVSAVVTNTQFASGFASAPLTNTQLAPGSASALLTNAQLASGSASAERQVALRCLHSVAMPNGTDWPKYDDQNIAIWQPNIRQPDEIWSITQMLDNTLFHEDKRGWQECQQNMVGASSYMYWLTMSTGSKHRGCAAICKGCDAMCSIAWNPGNRQQWPDLRSLWLAFWHIDIRQWSHVPRIV